MMICNRTSDDYAELIEAAEMALAYFRDTRHGRDWTESGGMEAAALEAAFARLRGEAPPECDSGEDT